MSEKINKYLCSIGLRFPENEEEINSFNTYYSDYDHSLDKNTIDPEKILSDIEREKTLEVLTNKYTDLSKSKSFFYRLVLATEIISSCHQYNTFGSVKFQKLLYLCEQVSNMSFSSQYSKQAAGPYDNKFMHSVYQELTRQKWFKVEVEKGKKFQKTKFTPLENLPKYKTYYDKYYHNVDTDIKFIISTFCKAYTNDVELVATIFYCWVDIIEGNKAFTDDILIDEVYEFHKEKYKFSPQQIKDSKDWMIQKGIYPKNALV